MNHVSYTILIFDVCVDDLFGDFEDLETGEKHMADGEDEDKDSDDEDVEDNGRCRLAYVVALRLLPLTANSRLTVLALMASWPCNSVCLLLAEGQPICVRSPVRSEALSKTFRNTLAF